MSKESANARQRWTILAASIALAAMFLLHLGDLTFVDPDLWHEMALYREGLALGYLPLEDRFAYTPTIYPSVHHEWGTGAILYAVATLAGGPGLMVLKYLLVVGVTATTLTCARRCGASWPVILSLAAPAIWIGIIGFTTIRAQLFTLLFIALLAGFMAQDRQGGRRWMVCWVPLFVLWLNLHAGFIVGLGLLAVHTVEQALRGQPMRHLLLLAPVLGLAIVVNPYGWSYYPYLAHALTMARPLITEWAPLWTAERTMFLIYLLSMLVLAYAFHQLGWQRMPGLLVCLVTALAALRHTRHISIYAVVWLCYVPGWIEQTSLAPALCSLWTKRQRMVVCGAVILAGLCFVQAWSTEPWRLRIPAATGDEAFGRPLYPVGAVEYLEQQRFEGNLMVPFVPGGYVSWKLHPRVKVSIDGRYEVVYQRGLLEESVHFYEARPGWQDTLAKYPTDLVLAPRSSRLATCLAEESVWRRVYRDDAYDLYARPGLALPTVERSGATLVGSIP